MTNPAQNEQIAKESVPITFFRVLGHPYLRITALRCIASIFRNFFFLQWRSAFLPGRIPVTKADHPLDSKIPFMPAKVNTYLDFVAFWVRTLGFLLREKGRLALEPVRNFIETMDGLYAFAAEVYKKNLSTTERPFYVGSPRFLLIHAVDPHLMCVPSLHVMVVIRTYSLFREIIKNFKEENRFSQQMEELRLGALAITEAVLYVKQHSVNCIPAAMYAMTRFDPQLFPPAEAGYFVSKLFAEAECIGKQEIAEIRAHILSLYHSFLDQGGAAPAKFNSGGDWAKPLIDFLEELSVGRKTDTSKCPSSESPIRPSGAL